MGIKGLMKLIKKNAPDAIVDLNTNTFSGSKIAIDASVLLYQFLSSIRNNSSDWFSNLTNNNYQTPHKTISNEETAEESSPDANPSNDKQAKILNSFPQHSEENSPTNDVQTNETTSHLVGLFYRGIKFIELGIHPIFVFDGSAPQAKADELSSRREAKEKNQKLLEQAIADQDTELASKLARRTVRVSRSQTEDSKTLLALMGFSIVQAPEEAESQCTDLVKKGLCKAVASEDTDLLPLGCPLVIRNFTGDSSTGNPRKALSKKSKAPTLVHLDRVLKGLGLTQEQFVDLCLLCGSDYGGRLKQVGPETAFKLVKEHGSLDTILDRIKKDFESGGKLAKYCGEGPEELEKIRETLKLAKVQFLSPKVLGQDEVRRVVKAGKCEVENVKKFLVAKGFNEERLDKSLKRMKEARDKVKPVSIAGFLKKRK